MPKNKKYRYLTERIAGITGWLSVVAMLFISMFAELDLPVSFNLFLVLTTFLITVETVVEVITYFKEQLPNITTTVKKIIDDKNGMPGDNIVIHENSAYSEPY